MTTGTIDFPPGERDLALTRLIPVRPAALFRAWSEPDLIKQWFAPSPWQTVHAEIDLRAGGTSLVVMRSPEGQDFPNRGVYLDVVPDRKLVFTDAYVSAWEPSDRPFFTSIVTFEPEGDATRYTALARHWSVADREAHERMGFREGWGRATDQLAALVARM